MKLKKIVKFNNYCDLLFYLMSRRKGTNVYLALIWFSKQHLVDSEHDPCEKLIKKRQSKLNEEIVSLNKLINYLSRDALFVVFEKNIFRKINVSFLLVSYYLPIYNRENLFENTRLYVTLYICCFSIYYLYSTLLNIKTLPIKKMNHSSCYKRSWLILADRKPSSPQKSCIHLSI